MNNLQKIIKWSKPKNCVMSVVPVFGGSWASSIGQTGPQPVLPPVAGNTVTERSGLLVKHNCNADNGDFRLADSSAGNWHVKTRLDLRGWNKPFTAIINAYIAPDNPGAASNDNDNNPCHPLLTQGYMAGSAVPDTCFCIGYMNQNNANAYRVHLSTGTYMNIRSITPASDPHGTWVRLAVSVDVVTGQFRFYENGALRSSLTISQLIGLTLNPDTNTYVKDSAAILQEYPASWVNRNDRVKWVMFFDKVLSGSMVKFLSYDYRDWIDLRVNAVAGLFNVETTLHNLEWILPDGTISSSNVINQTIGAGELRLRCYKYGLNFIIRASTSLANAMIPASGIPRVASTLYLENLPGLTGNTSELPRVANTLYLINLSGLTGTASDLPLNTGTIKWVYKIPNITGALSVVAGNASVYYYDNALVTPAEYDQTIQNVVNAGASNGTLRISNTRTSASDANVQTLRDRGWTITEH